MSARRAPLPTDPTDVTIDGFTYGGEGVGRIDGKAVFVPGTIPGERVRVRVVDDRRTWARAELLEVLAASPDRVVPPCPYVHPDRDVKCGGCDLQHITPARQRLLKTRVVREQLTRLGGIEDPPVAETLEVGPDAAYRNRAQFHSDDEGRLGFHASGTHDVVPIDRCLVLAPMPQALREGVGDGSGAAEVEVRGHRGGGAAVLRPGDGPLQLPEGEADLLLTQPDGSAITMRGDGMCSEVVGGLTYRFPADGFFQVNTLGAEALVDHVLRTVGEIRGALVWDLYAGVGLFSVPLAMAGADVVAVEAEPSSAAFIEENAQAAGATVRATTGDVATFVSGAAARQDPPDVVLLDPPRSGAGEDVCGALVDLRPADIVYVACDVAALARDARTIVGGGYELVSAQPLDLFPHTHHVEVVAQFRPAHTGG
ncbi:MAG: class I SAM-dependent RNA methyltransferase [Nitriliruptorales bacterium]|nr:class I SAM-dependent RNA methyltransferase [Nitriliruptorales bacterium]